MRLAGILKAACHLAFAVQVGVGSVLVVLVDSMTAMLANLLMSYTVVVAEVPGASDCTPRRIDKTRPSQRSGRE